MRAVLLLSCLLALSLLVSAAQASSSGQDTAGGTSAESSAPVTLVGCVTSMNGHFSLATRTGLVRLKGDHDSLLGHNGQQVRIIGTMKRDKKSGRQTLTISELKKISDSCQN
jgi:hypothetical protein